MFMQARTGVNRYVAGNVGLFNCLAVKQIAKKCGAVMLAVLQTVLVAVCGGQ